MDTTTVSTQELAEKLRKFYGEAKSKGGDFYHKNTLKNIRSAINRHMQDLGRAIDVIRGVEFRSANRVLDGMLKQMTKQGQSRPTQHEPVLESEDLVKIATYFQKAMLSPVMLRHCVWYYISIHFVSRGLEFHHQLKRDSLIFQTDDKGDEYVTLSHECQQKNFQGGLNSEEAAADKRMYATGRDDCPVQMLRHFIQRTDDEATHLFNSCTHEALASPSTTAKWYGSKPLNKRTFTRFMPDISKSAGCSMKYTAHCLRATAIQAMNDAGYESRHIMFMSGDRNEGSLRSYSRHMSTTQKRLLSSTLSSVASGSAPSAESSDPNLICTPLPCRAIVPLSTSSDVPDQLIEPMSARNHTISSSSVTSSFQSSGFLTNCSFSNCNFTFNK